MLADDFVLIQGGKRYSAAETLEFNRGLEITDFDYAFRRTQFGADGNLAFLVYDLDLTFLAGGTPTDASSVQTAVLRREPDGWRLVVVSVVPRAGQ